MAHKKTSVPCSPRYRNTHTTRPHSTGFSGPSISGCSLPCILRHAVHTRPSPLCTLPLRAIPKLLKACTASVSSIYDTGKAVHSVPYASVGNVRTVPIFRKQPNRPEMSLPPFGGMRYPELGPRKIKIIHISGQLQLIQRRCLHSRIKSAFVPDRPAFGKAVGTQSYILVSKQPLQSHHAVPVVETVNALFSVAQPPYTLLNAVSPENENLSRCQR